ADAGGEVTPLGPVRRHEFATVSHLHDALRQLAQGLSDLLQPCAQRAGCLAERIVLEAVETVAGEVQAAVLAADLHLVVVARSLGENRRSQHAVASFAVTVAVSSSHW